MQKVEGSNPSAAFGLQSRFRRPQQADRRTKAALRAIYAKLPIDQDRVDGPSWTGGISRALRCRMQVGRVARYRAAQ